MADASVQAAARHQQRVEELCAASIRALTGEADLHFRGRRLYRGLRALPALSPHLQPSLESDDFESFRGAADGIALRLAHSDFELHERLRPEGYVERLLFEWMEQARVESLVPAGMPGVRHNLRHRHERWSIQFHHSGLTDTAQGLLLYTVLQITRARVTGEQAVEQTEDMLEATRAGISPVLGHDLAGLRTQRDDQAAYAVHALAIARIVGEMIRNSEAERRDGDDREPTDKDRAFFSLFVDFEADKLDVATGGTLTGSARSLAQAADGYRVFTTAYDREVQAGSLVRKALLVEQRELLDKRIAEQGLNVTRLARELKRLFGVNTPDGWDGGQEEGVIDGRRLARLIASPTERRIFRTERIEPLSDSVVTFLIDCSASMNAHIQAVAMLVDVFARALDQAGVSNEMLGFTTGAWNGGRARRDWLKAGQPPRPGRLNERMHMVFKDADTSWRRARPDIAALLKADLFREGIDGEAVSWACDRLKARDERRRVLIVVSDGCPMDGATHLANDEHYLDHHLREVVQREERAGQVEIYGVGVGLDLSPYYSRSHALDVSVLLTNQVYRELLGMIAGHRRR